MTERPALPAGISYQPDLSSLSPAERMKHHRNELQRIDFLQGAQGVAAYKLQYPESRDILIHGQRRAYIRKPKGYAAAILSRIVSWATNDEARAATNRADVAGLGAQLGMELDANRHFSRPLSPSLLTKVREELATLGVHLPQDATSPGKIKKALRAIAAGSQPQAKPFASVGRITGQTLSVGRYSFTIQRSGNGREFIRVSIGGTKRRLYLDELEWFADLLSGGDTGDTLLPITNSNTGERATCPNLQPIDPLATAPETHSPGERAIPGETPTLSERIARLAAAKSPQTDTSTPSTIDPLEL